jgi:hypothetical protein
MSLNTYWGIYNKMKKCPKCNEEKEFNHYAKNSSRKDGLQRICKTCVKKQDASLYKKDKSKIVKRNKKYADKTIEWFNDYKKNLSCEICGEKRFWVLDFHHKDPNEKDFNIGDKWKQGYSISKIKNEINKCMCVCANCHRNIHFNLKLNI